ncbi:MAG TPA: hypothetical protein DDW23_05410 [Planctomycetes bacterium]|nr:hypothetical protein [Planctomycetota bacterium]
MTEDKPVSRLFRGGRIFDGRQFHENSEIRCGGDGLVVEVGQNLTPAPEDEIVDIEGHLLMPGLVDCHVHFREPGLERKEGYSTGSAGALHGGVTTVLEIQNNPPLMVSRELLEAKLEGLKGVSRVDYAPYGSLTLDAIGALAGMTSLCPAVKCFLGCSTGAGGVKSRDEMKALFTEAAGAGIQVVAHCEDNAVMERASQIASPDEALRHDFMRPSEAEIVSIRDAIEVAEEVGTRLHVFHISSEAGARLVVEAAKQGFPVTGSTAPHYLLLTGDEAHEAPENRMKVNPSVKSPDDRRGLAKLLGEGLLPVVGTDHAPHPLDEKRRPYSKAPSGFPSVDILLPLMFAVADRHDLPLETVLSAVTSAPAEEFGLSGKGALAPGCSADLVLVDTESVFQVDESLLPSRSKWSPYHGWELRGRPLKVWLRGRPVWDGSGPVGVPLGRPLFPK